MSEGGTAGVIVIDFRHEGRPVVLCLFEAGPVPEAYSSNRSEIAFKPQLPPRTAALAACCAKVVTSEGVQFAHPGLRNGSCWCRTGPDCGGYRGAAEIQGLGPGSSPTSGTHNPSSEGFLL